MQANQMTPSQAWLKVCTPQSHTSVADLNLNWVGEMGAGGKDIEKKVD